MQDIRLFNNEWSRMKVSSRTQPECVRKQEIVNFSGDQADDRILEHLIQTIKAGAAEVESGGALAKRGTFVYDQNQRAVLCHSLRAEGNFLKMRSLNNVENGLYY
jgi:hypothetical protein